MFRVNTQKKIRNRETEHGGYKKGIVLKCRRNAYGITNNPQKRALVLCYVISFKLSWRLHIQNTLIITRFYQTQSIWALK